MRITVNGDARELPDGLSVQGLLDALRITGERVAVEVNLEVVKRDKRHARLLAEGDAVEIVSFVGGGL